MKKPLLICFSLAAAVGFSQPVILNGSNVPSPGYTAPVSIATPVSIGSPGANQTWDFSALSFSSVGTMSVIAPSSSSMASSFPSANYAYTLAGTTSFFTAGTTKMEVLAYSITAPGSGNDYSPNPRTTLKFPFTYLDTVSDLWQKVGGPVETVTLTYDGYGTLITPTATYTNVVRVKEDYGAGAVDYQWYLTNPLMAIMVYDHNNNLLYSVGATVSGAEKQSKDGISAVLYPNPAGSMINVAVKGTNAALKMKITNSLGQLVAETSVNDGKVTLDLSAFASGIYYYELADAEGSVRRGKFVKE